MAQEAEDLNETTPGAADDAAMTDTHAETPPRPEPVERVVGERDRVDGGKGTVVDVARHHDEVDVLGLDGLDQVVDVRRLHREEVRVDVAQRARVRRAERVQKHGTLRFFTLVLVIIITAVVVTVVMFETLARVAG